MHRELVTSVFEICKKIREIPPPCMTLWRRMAYLLMTGMTCLVSKIVFTVTQCCCPWEKSSSSRILEDQFTSPCPQALKPGFHYSSWRPELTARGSIKNIHLSYFRNLKFVFSVLICSSSVFCILALGSEQRLLYRLGSGLGLVLVLVLRFCAYSDGGVYS